MRNSGLTLFLLGTNVLLLCLWLRKPAPSPQESVQAKISALAMKAPLPSAPAAPDPASIPVEEAKSAPFKWAQLESEDYRTYIKRLRDIGCPEQTIRDIIIADLDKLMAPKFIALDPQEDPKYWKAEEKDLRNKDEELKKLFEKQHLDFEKREVIKDLMGIDLVAERASVQGSIDPLSKRLNFLSTDKLALVRMIHDRADLEETALRDKALASSDSLSPADKAKLRKIQLDRERQVKALLSPDEIERYELWYSPAAFRTRDALAPLNPSEEEFKSVYALQRQFDENWSGVDTENLPSGMESDYAQAAAALQEQVREKLGADRFQQFQQAQDNDFRQLRVAAAQFGLSPETISDVLGFKNIVVEQRQRVASQNQLAPAQRDLVLQAISDETEKAVIEVMGPKAYRAYIKGGAGKWIKP
jgi:hypothetical protein